MRLSYKQVTFTEYRAAAQMFKKRNPFFRYDQILWVTLSIASLIAYGIVHRDGGSEKLCNYINTLFYYSVCLAIGLPLLRNINVLLEFRAYQKTQNESTELITEIDGDRIIDTTPGTCELIYEWKSVTGIGQNKTITIICTKGRHFLFFPTSAFNPEQLTEFKKIASGYNVRRWSC